MGRVSNLQQRIGAPLFELLTPSHTRSLVQNRTRVISSERVELHIRTGAEMLSEKATKKTAGVSGHKRISGAAAGDSARPKKATGKAARTAQKAQPLKFFNVKTSERFVFRRRDKKCLTLPPRSSLIPVFIHFSDIFPDLVQSTLSKCR